MPDISDLSTELDEDISNFKISDLDVAEGVTIVKEIVLRQFIKDSTSESTCRAINKSGKPNQRKCSTPCWKGDFLCQRHRVMMDDGKPLVLAKEDGNGEN